MSQESGEEMRNNFEKVLNEVIDNTLKEILSEPATRIIYQHLEMNYKLKPEDIANRIGTFKEGLERFLSSGALVIEDIITKRLYRHYKLKFENKEGYTFTDYVKELEKKTENS